ncbi:COG4705 family protein [Nocardia bovistercoris]|uniref:Membrane-anchored protein n=1 Tax=Nocardia bovistercoris TaxID=2785916 RepID=A0A931N3M1_9NOCA|nr:hypothetical protein [Nocardia bovistercoris]MBH0776693.1 hypothetical protein [Nocardia bovistercoris]
MLSKVPEVTLWFWVIKILCTTVGESFADWMATTLGLGLDVTATLFTGVLVAVLGRQLRMNRYVPVVYWSTVVVLSVSGTLYTDILTDDLSVPLAVSTSVFAVVLAGVFGIWYARERTLSIHSIVTTPREVFYWVAVLVTFALGTAVGDWVLQLTGWGPGVSVLLPAGLIAAVVLGWRCGANAVLSFWSAYILTRPLGANLGDWFASPTADHGLGVGTAVTSVVFLVAIAAVMVYLTRTRRDVIDADADAVRTESAVSSGRERLMVGYFAVVALVAVSLVGWASTQPHESVGGDDEAGAQVSMSVAPGTASAHFPPEEVAKFRTIAQDTLSKVRAGQQSEAKMRVKDLETVWDKDESTLRSIDRAAWTTLDGQIDAVLEAIRARKPDPSAEIGALSSLLTSLG